ncbi:hypothetical protein AAEO56_10410 [Flavobacterium sp. DGU11]|uniref:Immunity protein 26 n=1 Tax=Flavobacterium arundinis TaxID=3139143 RepID=A0ABU9HY68_9FLAO
MKKVEFKILPKYGDRVVTANHDKYVLLMYYMSERNDIPTITRIISELEIVKSGEKTFEEVFTDIYGTIPISWIAGEFECDKDNAYFISNNPDNEPSFEMPLQELINLMQEWKAFLEG